jgi:hypothetical protein
MKNIPVRSRVFDCIFIHQFLGAYKKGTQMILTAGAKLPQLNQIRHHTIKHRRVTHFDSSINQIWTFHLLSPPHFRKLAQSVEKAIGL